MTHGDLDNGRGLARKKLFRHKHEMETGRTSSVGNDILGFNHEGNVINKPDHGNLDWTRICEQSSKVQLLFLVPRKHFFKIFRYSESDALKFIGNFEEMFPLYS